MTYSTPQKLLESTIQIIEGAYAPATIRVYRANFLSFIAYCDKRNLNACPAEPGTAAGYISKSPNQVLKRPAYESLLRQFRQFTGLIVSRIPPKTPMSSSRSGACTEN